MKKILVLMALALTLVATLYNSTPTLANNTSPETTDAIAVAAATTLKPTADAFVNSVYPNTNYGSSTQLRVDGSPVTKSYLRFNVSLTSGTISKATLRLYANSSSSGGYSASRVASNSWSESTINYSNAPAVGSAIGSSGAVTAGTWTSIDVTAYVTGSGTFSFALTTASSTALSLASRESANPPQLVITAGTTASPTPTKTATTVPPTPTKTATPPPSATPTQPAIQPTATPVSSNYQPTAPIRAAFFYPWFPEAWTQQGIFPYTNYHPSWGYYSSTDDTIIDKQISLAAQAHLDAFISSWWGQGHHTDTALQYILGRSGRVGSPNPNLRWAIYYENESQGDPTATQLTSDLNYLASTVFKQPVYLRVNGKPVVFVYAAANDACGMADRWVQAKKNVGGNVYLVLKVFPGYLNCASQPDSWHQYSPAVGFDQQGTLAAVASPGFWLKGSSVRLVRDPVRFEADVKKVATSGAFWQLITTWSEWGEGTIVEPAQEWGNTYIDILTRNFPAR